MKKYVVINNQIIYGTCLIIGRIGIIKQPISLTIELWNLIYKNICNDLTIYKINHITEELLQEKEVENVEKVEVEKEINIVYQTQLKKTNISSIKQCNIKDNIKNNIKNDIIVNNEIIDFNKEIINFNEEYKKNNIMDDNIDVCSDLYTEQYEYSGDESNYII